MVRLCIEQGQRQTTYRGTSGQQEERISRETVGRRRETESSERKRAGETSQERTQGREEKVEKGSKGREEILNIRFSVNR